MTSWDSLRVLLVAAFATIGTTAAQPTRAPGWGLERGMQLVYASQGRESPPWRVDSLELGVRYGGRTACSAIRFGANDLRRGCTDRDTLFAWNEARQQLVPSRPLGAGMTLRVAASNGRTLLYETAATEDAKIGERRLQVLRTTVTTLDSTGTVVRRLRERYALALGTAIDGIFERPSAGAPGEWTLEQEFALVRIEPAPTARK